MAAATPEQIRDFFHLQIELWNAQNIDAFLAAFHAIATGGFRVEDPVGSANKDGWPVLEELCRVYKGWHMEIINFIVNGKHAAAHIKNTGVFDGKPITAHSIETYVFEDDGSMLARYYHPPH
ncbi:MAG: hypothetical protein JWM78_1363 [Verrucomicrobiaceae bacterium]|nr:hypothetical protein [Verrucomicrobiaceae bacterium]